jgi:SNF2 family DNA or RNA helicase
MLKRSQLHDYQVELAERFIEQKKLAGWLGLGLGKTASTLTAITDLIDGFAVNKVLIIAPLRVANTVWHTEIKKWEHTQQLTHSIVTGEVKKRRAALHKDADIYLINRENVPWLIEQSGFNWVWDCVIIDEASSFKNPSAKRFKALKKVLPKVNYLLELTGTPMSNGYMDLWSQMFLLDNGQALGRNITAYRNRYFNKDYSGFNYVIRKGAEEEIKTKIKPLVLSKKGVVDIPATYMNRIGQLPPALMTLYKQFKKEFVLMLEDDGPLVALNAAALGQKLNQFGNGFIYDETGTKRLHTIKLDMLDELMEETDSPVLVFYNFKEDLVMLKERFPFAREFDADGKILSEWKTGKVKMLIASPQSMAHGVDGLQHGGNVIVWYGLTWSLELYEQANGRIIRQGQKEHVTVVHLVIEGCHDSVILQALENKAVGQNEMLEYMKNYYNSEVDL